jgi:predicted peptidase
MTTIGSYGGLGLVVAVLAYLLARAERRIAERDERLAAAATALTWINGRHARTVGVAEAAASYLSHIDAESPGPACFQAEQRLRRELQAWRSGASPASHPEAPAGARLN